MIHWLTLPFFSRIFSDLQLAAELGKTLLERNKELENLLRAHQRKCEDQKQEIEVSSISLRLPHWFFFGFWVISAAFFYRFRWSRPQSPLMKSAREWRVNLSASWRYFFPFFKLTSNFKWLTLFFLIRLTLTRVIELLAPLLININGTWAQHESWDRSATLCCYSTSLSLTAVVVALISLCHFWRIWNSWAADNQRLPFFHLSNSNLPTSCRYFSYGKTRLNV